MAKNEAIAALLELHRVDTEIDKIKSQKELLPVSLRRIATRLQRRRTAIEEKKARIKQLRAETHAKEVLLRGAEQEVDKLDQQLRKVRTNKEYTALQHEIAAKKVDSSRIEDDVLALMADTEALEEEIRELTQGAAQMQREQADESGLVEQEVERLDGRLSQLQQQRHGVAAKVEPDLRDEYERIAAKKGSSAIAPVVGQTCQGCFMKVPPQFSHDLKAGTRIVHCPHCSRILYLP